MKKPVFGIYDREPEYAKRLGGYIRKRCGDALEVRVFTRKEVFLACLREGKLDLTLSDPEEISQEARTDKTVRMAVLSESWGENRWEKRGEGENEKEVFCITRYQSAEQIWKGILQMAGDEICLEYGGEKEGEKKEILGICSPVRGCGETALGLCMGRILAKHGEERVLFVTMEEFSPLAFFLGESEEDAELSELYYYYCQGKLTKVRLEASVSRWGGLDYLFPVKLPMDLYRDGRPYAPEFFRKMAELGEYRYLILDMGNSIWGKEGLLKICKKIYVPGRANPADESRTERFLGWSRELGISEKLIYTRIPPELGESKEGNLDRIFSGKKGWFAGEVLKQGGYGEGKDG